MIRIIKYVEWVLFKLGLLWILPRVEKLGVSNLIEIYQSYVSRGLDSNHLLEKLNEYKTTFGGNK